MGDQSERHARREERQRQPDGGSPPPATRAPVRLLEECLCGTHELVRRRVRLPQSGSFGDFDGTSITSTMFMVKLSRDEPTDLHEQVAAQIRRAIANGEAGPGDRLPPARDLAAELGVNRNTVLRALRALRDEGLLEFARGRGVTVSGTQEHGTVIERARELVKLGREHGYRVEELVELVQAAAAPPTS